MIPYSEGDRCYSQSLAFIRLHRARWLTKQKRDVFYRFSLFWIRLYLFSLLNSVFIIFVPFTFIIRLILFSPEIELFFLFGFRRIDRRWLGAFCDLKEFTIHLYKVERKATRKKLTNELNLSANKAYAIGWKAARQCLYLPLCVITDFNEQIFLFFSHVYERFTPEHKIK